MRLAQFIGQAMPVEDSTHCPHILQSNRSCLAVRSTVVSMRSARFAPNQFSGLRKWGATRPNTS